MNRKLHLALLVLIGLTLAACTPKPTKQDPTVVDDGGSTNVVDNDVDGTGLTRAQLNALGINGNPLDYKTVHFAYNSTAFTQRSTVIVKAHARELNRRGGARVNLEGHADERGTRDYNLALGERRALAVAGLMNATGAGGSSINSISYGEERPVDSAHNEDAWHKNRRVQIAY